MIDTGANSPDTSVRRSGSRFTQQTIAIVVLAVVLLLFAAGEAWAYSTGQRSLAESQQANTTLGAQLAKSQQETKDRQTELDAVRQQLSGSQAELAAARDAGKALSDQLKQANDKELQSEAAMKGLQDANSGLSAQAAISQLSDRAAQANIAGLNDRITRVKAKAQLVDQFVRIGTSTAGSDEKTQMTLSWLANLQSLGDPKIDGYLQAFVKNPKDSTPLYQLLAYLTGSVVTEL